jgi:hypothetical protein
MGDHHGNRSQATYREPRNKGQIVGQKAPFKLKDMWALRVRLQMENRERELALFNLGIDSKLRGCDLVALKVRDVCHGDQVASRAVVVQHKTRRPVQFEITPAARDAVQKWITTAGLKPDGEPPGNGVARRIELSRARPRIAQCAARMCRQAWTGRAQRSRYLTCSAPLGYAVATSSRRACPPESHEPADARNQSTASAAGIGPEIR